MKQLNANHTPTHVQRSELTIVSPKIPRPNRFLLVCTQSTVPIRAFSRKFPGETLVPSILQEIRTRRVDTSPSCLSSRNAIAVRRSGKRRDYRDPTSAISRIITASTGRKTAKDESHSDGKEIDPRYVAFRGAAGRLTFFRSAYRQIQTRRRRGPLRVSTST